MEAEQYHRPDFNQMIGVVWDLLQKYGRTISKIYVDGANTSFIRALKLQMGEDEEYDQVIKDCKASHRDFEYDKLSIKLFIYESGPNHEEMEGFLCT